ncbi:tetratricopeptide repeat protein [Bacteroides sp.]
MQCYPDSALFLLEGVGETSALSIEDRAYYALLLTQARDKNYIEHTTDSLIRIAIDYYDSVGDNALQTKAHYYLARVYQDMDSVPGAVREFMMAKQWAEEIKDSIFIYLSCANLGGVLKKHDLLNEADVFYQQAEKIAALNNDSLHYAIMLMNRAEISILRGERYYSEAEVKLLYALKIAKSISNVRIERSVAGALGSLYSNMERYNDVIHWEQYYLKLQPDSMKRFGSYLNLGDAFYQLQKYDLALYYLLKSSLSPNCYTKSGAYEILSKVAEKKGLLVKSLHWKDSCLVYTNLSTTISQPVKAIVSLKDVINQQSIKRYEYLTQEQWRIIIWVIVILLGLLCYFICKQKKSQAQLVTREKTYLTEREQFYQDNCAKMTILNEQLNGVRTERDRMFVQLLHALPVFKELVVLLEKNRELEELKSLIDAKLWKEVVVQLNSITDNFTVRLENEYPKLKKVDIHFCCLLKMGFKYQDIACLCGRTLSMMYKRSSIAVDRMGLSDEFSLESFVRTF